MKIGIIGLGAVGQTLKKYLVSKTDHEVFGWDPPKKIFDDLSKSSAIFICVPVDSTTNGPDMSAINEAVKFAKNYSKNIFIRSTVLPGTSDTFKTTSMPEFLTERRAYQDMCELPIVCGKENCNNKLVKEVFPDKEIIFVKNKEAELAKFTHNCFGAFKVIYFNMIKKISKEIDADFEEVKFAANITGYLGSEHMAAPGHDGQYGYGGKCFPNNMSAMRHFLRNKNKITDRFENEAELFDVIKALNTDYRINGL